MYRNSCSAHTTSAVCSVAASSCAVLNIVNIMDAIVASISIISLRLCSLLLCNGGKRPVFG